MLSVFPKQRQSPALRRDKYQPLSPPPRDRLSSQDHDEGSANFSHFDIRSVELEEKASDHEVDVVDGGNRQLNASQNGEDETAEPLQRPIAELEAKLGIRFDDLSDDEDDEEVREDDKDAISSSSLSSSSVDGAIEDDRARLLSRAKKLLEEESFDSDDELS